MNKYTEKQKRLEREGKFDTDLLPYRTDNMRLIDEHYPFGFTFAEKLCRGIVLSLLYLVVRPLLFFACGFRIRGKENMKGVKGAIVITNHVHYFDCLMAEPLHSYFKVFHTGAGFNAKRDIRGWFLHILGFLPLNGSFGAQKNLKKRIGEILQKGGLVQFYPEHALWQGYQKPRPFKNGAFRYACDFSVPVIPTFITFEKGFLRRERAVLNVLPPVYPDKALSGKVQVERLRDESFAAFRACYEKAYGIPLVYEEKISESC